MHTSKYRIDAAKELASVENTDPLYHKSVSLYSGFMSKDYPKPESFDDYYSIGRDLQDYVISSSATILHLARQVEEYQNRTFLDKLKDLFR